MSWGWEELAFLDQGLEMDTGWDRPIGSMSLPWASQHLPLSDILTDMCLWLLSEYKPRKANICGHYIVPAPTIPCGIQ